MKSTSLGQAFNRLWSASLSSNFADGILSTSVPLLAVTLTESPVQISAITALVMLPWLFFAIPIGALVDRVDRRMALVFANSIRFIIGALLAISISTHVINMTLLYIFVFSMGVCEVLVDTTAQAMIPKMLDKENYERGNSRLAISENVVSQFVGSPFSSAIFVIAIFVPFFISSAGYLIAALFIFLIPTQFHASMNKDEDLNKTKDGFLAEIKFGIRYLYNEKKILRLVLTTTALGFFFSMATATNVLFLIRILHVKTSLFGLVMTVQAIGGIVGAFLTPKLSQRFGRGKVLATAIVVSAFPVFLMGFTTNIWNFLPLAILIGFSISGWNILLMSTYQHLIPNELFGRIHGTRRTLVWGIMPFGSLIGGVIATFGLRWPFIICGAIGSIIAIANYNFLKSLNVASSDQFDEANNLG